MTVIVSSPGQNKPVVPLWSIEDYVREHAGAPTLNTSSIKSLNGDLPVTALVHISSSSSSSSYQETVEQLTTQEPVLTDSVDRPKSNGFVTVDKEYVFVCFCWWGEGLGSIASRCSGSEPALTPSSFLGEENRARGSGGNGA